MKQYTPLLLFMVAAGVGSEFLGYRMPLELCLLPIIAYLAGYVIGSVLLFLSKIL